MSSPIPVKVDKAFFPSLSHARTFYTGILHDYVEGQALKAKDQEEILNLIRSSKSPYPTEGVTVRIGRGLFGSPCFVAVDVRERPYYVSIRRSLKKCLATKRRETVHQPISRFELVRQQRRQVASMSHLSLWPGEVSLQPFKNTKTASIESVLTRFIHHVQSLAFLVVARHPDFPTAFTRTSKLPLPTLVAVLCGFRGGGVQSELDTFFAHKHGEFVGASLLRPGDVLVLDRGYQPLGWCSCCTPKGIAFVIRCDSTHSWKAARDLLPSTHRPSGDECWAYLGHHRD